MSNITIKVENLSKIYKLYDKPVDRLKEAINPFRKKYHRDFYALKNINFEVARGETIGIIGKNGSGKSTLLKILTGVLTPTEGNIYTHGKVSALLELGTGFNPELTGMENIYFSAALMGYTKNEIDKKLDDIISFADIGEFINQPVKTYSSGMFVRLAFAVATNVDPEILIVDEALSVGDMFFQAKCMAKMKKMMEKGITLLFVSHSTGAIKSICEKTILLDNGEMIEFDKSDKVVEKYFSMRVRGDQKTVELNPDIAPSTLDKKSKHKAFLDNAYFRKHSSFQRIQNGMANFANVQLLDMNGNEIQTVEFGQDVILRMAIEINEDIHELSYGYHIRDANGIDVVYASAGIENKRLHDVKKGEKYVIDWKFRTYLMQGNYNIVCVMSIPIDEDTGQVCFCDFVPLAVQFNMNQRKPIKLYGLVHWPNEVEINKI